MTKDNSNAKRVPISMNAEEIRALEQLAKGESRSVAAMAGIIYRKGLEKYSRAIKSNTNR